MTDSDTTTAAAADEADDGTPPCVLVFNANDPSGGAGLAADVLALASVGAHPLPVLTGVYLRDTGAVFDHVALDDEAVAEQARAVLEDMSVPVIKVGFAGNPHNLSAIAELLDDYPDCLGIAYMPDLSWLAADQIEPYLDAVAELLLPQIGVLVGNHSTLTRWLLPDWPDDSHPGPRDIARAAEAHGVPYTLVTGLPMSDQRIDNALASPLAVLCHQEFAWRDASYSGAGDTLSAALAGLLASGVELDEAARQALQYLDQCLAGGYRPGMGQTLPDRLFWADGGEEDPEGPEPAEAGAPPIQ